MPTSLNPNNNVVLTVLLVVWLLLVTILQTGENQRVLGLQWRIVMKDQVNSNAQGWQIVKVLVQKQL